MIANGESPILGVTETVPLPFVNVTDTWTTWFTGTLTDDDQSLYPVSFILIIWVPVATL
jgi:hypothetical protein